MAEHRSWTRWCDSCRWEDCTTSAREYRRAYRLRTQELGGLGEDGARYRYVTGAGARRAGSANAAYDNEHRARRRRS